MSDATASLRRKISSAATADCLPGDDVIALSLGSCGMANGRMEKPVTDTYALNWFMAFKKLPEEKLHSTPTASV